MVLIVVDRLSPNPMADEDECTPVVDGIASYR